MTKICETNEVCEIDRYLDFKNSIADFLRLGQIEKALKLYEQARRSGGRTRPGFRRRSRRTPSKPTRPRR